MKRLLITALPLFALLLSAGPAQAAPAGTLQDFGTGTVMITGDSATIVNATGQFGGVFNKSKSQSGMLLGDVSFSFNSTGDVAGGAPRFSLPINTDGTGGSVAGYAFIDAHNCGAHVGPNTTVSTTVSTGNPNCRVFFGSSISGFDNWAAFAAANPTYRIAQGHFPFIIADEPGSYAVTSIFLG